MFLSIGRGEEKKKTTNRSGGKETESKKQTNQRNAAKVGRKEINMYSPAKHHWGVVMWERRVEAGGVCPFQNRLWRKRRRRTRGWRGLG